MHFNIEYDEGDQVIAWLVPDNPSETPRLRVRMQPDVDVLVEANEQRDDIREAGLHESGRCGFRIGPQQVPGLSAASKLTIIEPRSGLVLFQRPRLKRHVEGRLFRLETRCVPRSHLDGLLQSKFHMNFVNLHRVSAETCYAILNIAYSNSIYVSGRFPWIAVRDVLRRGGFKLSVLLGDPFRELFSRLVVIKGDGPLTAEHGDSLLLPLEVKRKIQSALRDVAMNDISAVARAVGGLDTECRRYLSDPLTRQLTDSEPGQALERDALQRAILEIADFDVVGLESDPGSFFETVCATLSTQFSVNGTLGTTPDTSLGDALRAENAFRALLRHDSVVFDTVSAAVENLPDMDEGVDIPPPMLTFAGAKPARRAKSG